MCTGRKLFVVTYPKCLNIYLLKKDYRMKKILILILLVFFCSGSAFGDEFEDTLKKAEQGDATAQNNLGEIYFFGIGVPQDDKQAVYWYKKAAEQGHDDAQYSLGFMYYNGKEVTQNYKKAIYWYKKSAEQGYAYAQYHLGFMYDNGEGVTQNYKQTLYWYKKSAEQGIAEAQHNLATLYYEGTGVPQNFKKAYIWWSLAAAKGPYTAAENRNITAEKLTPQQLAEAQELAAQMQEKIDSAKGLKKD